MDRLFLSLWSYRTVLEDEIIFDVAYRLTNRQKVTVGRQTVFLDGEETVLAK